MLGAFAVTGTATAEESVPNGGNDAAGVEQAIASERTAATAEGSGATLFNEDFTGETVASSWKFLGDACLTAVGNRRADKYCSEDDGTRFYRGQANGFLQLTDADEGQTGSVLYDSEIQSKLGLDITFTQYQFGSSSNPPADGIGFFLTDGTTTLNQAGPTGEGVGGALGYSAIVDHSGRDSRTVAGIPNGVLGIGLDTFGNFSAKKEVGGDGTRDENDPSTKHQYSVTVRGKGEQNTKGEWKNGYGIIATTSGFQSLLYGDAPRVGTAGQNGGTKVNIKLSVPNESGIQRLTVTLTGPNGNANTAIDTDLTEKLPELIKFGFSASTGANNAVHFIRGVTAKTVETPKSDIMLTKSVDHRDGTGTPKQVFQAGDTVPYMFVVSNVGDNELSDVTDDKISAHEGSVTCPQTTLAVGASMTCTGSLTLTDDDIASGSFTNTATATGTDNNGTVSDEDSATITTFAGLTAPEHEKYIEKDPVASSPKDSYTLNLDVTGKSQKVISTTGSQTPVDVVLVVDNSNSMHFPVGEHRESSGTEGYAKDPNDERWYYVKQALNGMVESLFDADGSGKIDLQVGMVKFARNATKINLGDNGYSGDKATIENAIKALKVADKEAPDKDTETGGTDWYKALNTANDYKGREGAQKYVVFITDGQATRTNGDSNSKYDHEHGDQSGIWKTDTFAQGEKLVNNGWNVLNVGVDLFDSESPTGDQGKTLLTDFTNTLKNKAGTGENAPKVKMFDAQGTGIGSIFDQVGSMITNTTTFAIGNVSITDVLTDMAEPYTGLDSDGKPAVWENSKTLTVGTLGKDGVDVEIKAAKTDGNEETPLPDDTYFKDGRALAGKGFTVTYDAQNKTIKATFPTGYVLEDGYTYTLRFKVKPTQTAYDTYADNMNQQGATTGYTGDNAKGGEGFFTNAATGPQLSYCVAKSESDGYSCDGDNKMLDYDRPVLQVKTGQIKVTKKWDPATSAPTGTGARVTVKLYKDYVEGGSNTAIASRDLTSDNNWSATFENLAPGHTYKLEEVAVDGYTTTITYKNGDKAWNGKIIADDLWAVEPDTSKSDNVKIYEATVTNTRDITPATVNPQITKRISGRDFQNGDEFTFHVDANGTANGEDVTAPLPENVNAEGDYLLKAGEGGAGIDSLTRRLGAITFTQPGTYEYVISEKADGSVANMQYDSTQYRLVYRVTESNGVLTAERTQLQSRKGVDSEWTDVTNRKGMVFTNTVSKTPTVSLSGVKKITNRTFNDGEKYVFHVQSVDEQGNAANAPMPSNVKNGSYEFTATGDTSEGTLDFGTISFKADGTYRYLISEDQDGNGKNDMSYDQGQYLVTVSVTDGKASISQIQRRESQDDEWTGNATGTGVVFTNVYQRKDSTSVTITGDKLVKDSATGEETPATEAGQYEFELVDENGNVLKTANKSDGTFEFTLHYDDKDVDKELTYLVREKNLGKTGTAYDGTVYTVSVRVYRNENGNLVASQAYVKDGQLTDRIQFVNTVTPPTATTLSLPAHKTLAADAPHGGDFTFTVTDSDGNPVTSHTERGMASGDTRDWIFDPITFTEPGAYTYSVQEENGGQTIDGIKYDGTVYKITVNVTVDGNNQLIAQASFDPSGPISFENTAEDTPDPGVTYHQLTVIKKVVTKCGEDPDKVGSFLINVNNGETQSSLQYANSHQESFLVKDGATYTVSEPAVDGYTTTYTVTDGQGEVSADGVTGTPTGDVTVVVTNTATGDCPTPGDHDVPVTLDPGKKYLEGRALNRGEFTFELWDGGRLVDTATNDVSSSDPHYGSFRFDFKQEANTTKRYVMKERNTNLPNVTYDTKTYEVTVTTDDNGVKSVSYSPDFYDNGVAFKNTYTKPDQPGPGPDPDNPDPGNPDNPDEPTIPTTPTNPTTPEHPVPGLSKTGVAVMGVTGLALILLAAGAGALLWRRRGMSPVAGAHHAR